MNAPLAEQYVLTARDARGVATLTLNRPQQFNALSQEMMAALQTELEALAGDESVRVVVIGAQGKAFCPGHDLKQMKAKVARALAAGPEKRINVKLGRGGIREVEFVVQSLQLIHAGTDERIRERNSLAALTRLGGRNLCGPANRVKRLRRAVALVCVVWSRN